uniref:Calcineurin-like phosphoesterase n=1 Tax=viral metagenome TaxID=1070528 RepID=A0A6M3L312_9ZZZZ
MESEPLGLNNLIVVSDLHAGCRFGLCPPEPQILDGNNPVYASPLQNKVWQWWKEFWNEWVPTVTRHEPYAVLINGDSMDGVHHGNTTQFSQNLTDQKRIAERILEPIIEKCKGKFYMIRGTEAHVGKSGTNEEDLAKALGAIPDEEGNYARWEMWIEIGSGLVHAIHHIGTTGSLAYETTALSKEYTEACSDAGRWERQAPNIIVRSHRHRLAETRVPTEKGYGICVVTPGWQLKTPLVYRIAGGRLTTPQFGGVLIRAGNEELYTRHKVWSISRTPSVRL